MTALDDLSTGIFVGLIVGCGSFGGDGKQPQLTVRMHTRHEALFGWLMQRFPSSKLYGPYEHSSRSYYQWMARGGVLVDEVMPILDRHLTAELDAHVYSRFRAMQSSYAAFIESHERRKEVLNDNGR